MNEIKLLLENIAKTIGSNKVLIGLDNYSPDNKYHAIIIECGNNTNNNEQMFRIVANARDLDGQVIVLAPAAILFSTKHKKNREYLLKHFHIKGVITLKNTVFDFSAIAMALIILDNKKGDTWFTSASSMEEVLKLILNEKNHKHNVYYSSSVESINLMPEYYNGESKKIDNLLYNYETKSIEEIAELFIGKNVPSEELTDRMGFSYLRARNLIDGKIIASQYVKNEYIDKYSKQVLLPGDIVISKNFGEKRIAKVQEDDCPAIASNALIVVRALNVPEDYLYTYFHSRAGRLIFQKQLESIEKGTTIRTINLQDFKKIKIPIFDNVTMFEMMNINKLDRQELSNLSNHISSKIESEIEIRAIEMFRLNGWNKNEIVFEDRNFFIKIGNDRKYIPDIILMSDKGVLAIVEVTLSLALSSPARLEMFTELKKNKEVPIFIITNLNKFEIYLTREDKRVIFHTVPSKTQLLELIESEDRN